MPQRTMDRMLTAHAAALPGVLGAIRDPDVGALGNKRCQCRGYPPRPGRAFGWPFAAAR